jgi:hypothetical protein
VEVPGSVPADTGSWLDLELLVERVTAKDNRIAVDHSKLTGKMADKKDLVTKPSSSSTSIAIIA